MISRLRSAPEYAVRFLKSFRSRFTGVYPDYASAERAIPASDLTGYDHDQLTRIYVSGMGSARPSDYPVLFWLDRLLQNESAVFDFGGNVGVSYYTFSRYLHLPENLSWTVCDLPKVCRTGEEIAAERKAVPLRFTSDFQAANSAGVLLCLGTMQYLPDRLAARVATLENQPRHIIINRIPLWNEPEFVTLERIGPAQCAYRIFNEEQLLSEFRAQGYHLRDRWHAADLSCNVRFEPRYSIEWQSGLYLSKSPA